VVASAVGGLTTLVEDGVTGFLVEEPSPEAFAELTRRVLSEPLLSERLSTAAVLRARDYTWRSAAASLHEIHEELVAGRLVQCR